MKWRSIQCLRGLAAVGVLLFHFGDVQLGAAGVDLFFIISGFIMASVVTDATPRHFLLDRAWRILPPYFAAVALELLLIQPEVSARQLLISLTLWPVGMPVLHQSWTLSFEMLFYVGCAAYLAVGRAVLFLVPAALVGAALIDHPLIDFIGNPLILEFLGGMVLARLPRRFGGVALVAAPVVLALLWPSDLNRTLSFGLPSLLFIHGALSFEHRFQSDWLAPAMLLGDASYSIYLVHLTLGRLFSDDIPWTTAACGALIGGLLFHKMVEQPLLRYRRASRGGTIDPALFPVDVKAK